MVPVVRPLVSRNTELPALSIIEVPLLGRIYGEIGRAASGSSITKGATDWASDQPGNPVASNAARRTTETYKSPVEGERFFIKNIPNLYDGIAAGNANRDWLLGIQQQLPDYKLPEKFPQ